MPTIDSALSQTAAWGAMAVCGYLALGLVATLVARCAGGVGRAARVLLLLLYPSVARVALRSAVATAVGLGATLAGSTAAHAGAPRPPAPPVVAPASPPVEPLDWPVDAARLPSSARSAPAEEPRTSHGIVVRRGDCLWRIAARALGRAATPAATAAAWPSWWAANRAAIGDDPDLLRPGLLLRAPRTLGRSG